MRWPKPEQIVCAYADRCAGPGWANAPIWYIWRDEHHVLHEGCIQPAEQDEGLLTLFNVCHAAHRALLSKVSSFMWRKNRRRK